MATISSTSCILVGTRCAKQARTKTGVFAPGFWEENPRGVADVLLPLLPLLVPLAFLALTYWTNLGKFNLPFP